VGTDIHGVWVGKCAGTDKWFSFEYGCGDRSYRWFGIVAGVRTEEHFDAKGNPDIICDAWAHYDDDDLHSNTWLKPSEVMEANAEWLKRAKEEYPDLDWEANDEQPYQRIPEEDDRLTKLILEIGDGGRKIPWAGTLRQFIGEDADFNESVMYICAFDS